MSLSGNEKTGPGPVQVRQAYAGFTAKATAAAATIIAQVRGVSRFIAARVFGRVN